MSILLDTHALLWFLGNNPKLPKSIKEQIENTESVFVSLASIWEIAIKVNQDLRNCPLNPPNLGDLKRVPPPYLGG